MQALNTTPATIVEAISNLDTIVSHTQEGMPTYNWRDHHPEPYREALKQAKNIPLTMPSERVENISALRRALRPLIWVQTDDKNFREILRNFALLDKTLEDISTLAAQEYPLHIPNPNALLERTGNEAEIAAQSQSLEELESRLEALEQAAESGSTIEKRIVNHYTAQVANKIEISMFNISVGEIIDLESLERMLKSIARLTASFGASILDAASKAGELVKRQTGRVSSGVREAGQKFKTLFSRRIKPPDEATRKAWEEEAAVQILMGKPVPARRVPFIQELSLSGADNGLRDRLEAAGADLAEIYVDPSAGLRRVNFSDTTLFAKFTALTSLNLNGTQVADITPLENLTALRAVNVNITQVQDIAPLKKLTSLTRLYLGGTEVADIDPLKSLTALNQLNLDYTKVTDIALLENLTALITLGIEGTQVADITPLEKLTALVWLNLSKTKVKDFSAVDDIEQVIGDPDRDEDGFKPRKPR